MTEHTPGPWNQAQRPYIIRGPSGKIVAESYYSQMEVHERYANANLIAAAPELLEACEAALELFEELNVYGETPGMIQAAIAKAKGDGDDG